MASAFNRKKEYDVCILTCNDSKCYIKLTDDLTEQIRKHEWSSYTFPVSSKAKFSDIKRHIDKSIIGLVAVCQHNERQVVAVFDEMLECSELMLCSRSAVKSTVLKSRTHMHLKTADKIDKLIGDMTVILNSENQYNYFDSDDLYDTVGESSEDSEDTITNSSAYANIVPVSRKEDQDVYVDVNIHQSSAAESGVFVLKSYLLPGRIDEFRQIPVSDLIYSLNNEDRFSHDIVGFLLSLTAVEYNDYKRVQDLIKLFNCKNEAIQNKVFETLENILYTTEVRLWDVDDVIDAVQQLTSNMKNRYIHREQLFQLIHLISILFAILLLLTRIKQDGQTKTSQTTSFVLNILGEIDTSIQGETLQNLIMNLKSMISSMCSDLAKTKGLIIENWKDSLRRQDVKTKFLRFFHTFSPIEMFANIFAVINQILQTSQSGNVPLVRFLKELAEKAVEATVKGKEKKDTLRSSILCLITKAVVTLFIKSENGNEEYEQSVEQLLQYTLLESKRSKTSSKLVLSATDPLLFHKNRRVVEKIIYTYFQNNLKSRDIIIKTITSLEKKMQNLDIDIYENISANLPPFSVPFWYNVKGRLVHCNLEIYLHIRLPTLHCLMQGKMHVCKCSAKDKSTRGHGNNMDILHFLNEGHSCPSQICRMIAYQWKYSPIFYITPRYNVNSLSEFLLAQRTKEEWLPIDLLVQYCIDVIKAVEYIHSMNLIHRDLTARSFSVSNSGNVVLSRFYIAVKCMKNRDSVTDLEAEIPLRWSAPESILRDEFSITTDAWMIGQLMYEIFTHGCYPYTELYNYQLGEILELVFFRELKPRAWPCIPHAIHSVILSFVNTFPEKRATLDTGKKKMESCLVCLPSAKQSSLDNAETFKWTYPELDSSIEIETELPEYIKNFKESGPDPTSSYYNLDLSRRRQVNDLQISEGDLVSKDDPIIITKGPVLDIKEPATKRYLESSYPALKKQDVKMKGILNLKTWPPEVDRSGGEINLCYECYRGDNIVDIAKKKIYGKPGDAIPDIMYLNVVSAMVEFVQQVHSQKWVLKDVCGISLYYCKRTSKIFTSRIGRMVKLPDDTEMANCFKDSILTERKNWLPVETLECGLYSRESDMYMLAMTIYEFFAALDLCDPVDNGLERIPFCRVIKSELNAHLLRNDMPRKPHSCPNWLYDILRKCWSCDSTQRMTAENFADLLNERLKNTKQTTGNIDDEAQQSTSSTITCTSSASDSHYYSTISCENSTTTETETEFEIYV